MIEKIAQALISFAYPDRDVKVAKIGRSLIAVEHTVGCNDYVLDGLYNYDQVTKLNALTGYNCGFGYCKELGPIAFIGAFNKLRVTEKGNFKYKIQYYGQSLNDDICYFEPYSDEVAQKISNYTVYGFDDPRKLNNEAPIKYLHYFYDYRYRSREYFKQNLETNNVLEMTIKLDGTFSWGEAREFAYEIRAKDPDPTGFSGEIMPMQFAIVGDSHPVGIIGIWGQYDNVFFRDVWGDGEKQPEREKIRFISSKEAREITNFTLYYYLPIHSYGRKKYNIEKIDRTMQKGFNFIMPDGTDYRLQETKS